MITISSDVFGLMLLAQALAAWVAFALHLRQEAQLREKLTSLPAARRSEVTEPDEVRSPPRRLLPHTRATAPTVPLADLPRASLG